MTTELVLLLTISIFIIAGIFKVPSQTFEESGPHLGFRIEKQLETAPGFTDISQNAPNQDSRLSWSRKR